MLGDDVRTVSGRSKYITNKHEGTASARTSILRDKTKGQTLTIHDYIEPPQTLPYEDSFEFEATSTCVQALT